MAVYYSSLKVLRKYIIYFFQISMQSFWLLLFKNDTYLSPPSYPHVSTSLISAPFNLRRSGAQTVSQQILNNQNYSERVGVKYSASY